MAFNAWENLYCFREFSIVYLILMLNGGNMLRLKISILSGKYLEMLTLEPSLMILVSWLHQLERLI